MVNASTIFAIIIGLIVVGIIIMAVILHKKRKFEKAIRQSIPKELTETLIYLEQQMKGGLERDGKQINPYELLFRIAREGKFREQDEIVRGTVEPITNGELSPQPIQRECISSGDTSTDCGNQDGTINPKPNPSTLIERIRGKSRKGQL